jgi:glycosyltransferase involved in cell wall biosynthesis
MRIIDYYCHQGHQYEFFKTGHDFYLTGLDSNTPKWNTNHRPLNENVTLIDERSARKMKFDIVIVRSPLNPQRYMPYIKRGAVPIAVGQTTSPYKVLPSVRHMVWNSVDVMEKYRSHYPKRMQHHYIVHGFDPDEFRPIDGIEKNGRVLSTLNVFKKRGNLIGYDLWREVANELKICDVLGHGNPKLKESIGEAETFEEMIKYHNEYSVFFNPTNHSAMPRSRAEACMSAMPLVSTNNFDIGRYFKHRKNAILTNDKDELVKGIQELLENEEMRKEYGRLARQQAIKHFHAKDYIDKWNHLFESL